jgi:hypothetical protein
LIQLFAPKTLQVLENYQSHAQKKDWPRDILMGTNTMGRKKKAKLISHIIV